MSKFQRIEGYQLLLSRAQHHRDHPTISEQMLLSALNNQLPDLNFQFQVVMVPFIVDFVSLSKRVVIEVDGKSHVGNIDYDTTRQRDLERDGYSFIRFSHEEVMTSIDQVISKVRNFCALSHVERRKFASPQAEYIEKGTVPRVLGEFNPFSGLHSREELEDILREEDPYDILERVQTLSGVAQPRSNHFTCASCEKIIQPEEVRVRDHSSLEVVRWIHKFCRNNDRPNKHHT